MRKPGLEVVLLSAGLLLPISQASLPGASAAGEPTPSPRAEVTGTYVELHRRATIGIQLVDTADAPLWATVRFGAPSGPSLCELTKKLVPKDDTTFECEPEAIVTDVEYSVAVSVYADKDLGQLLEENRVSLRFARVRTDPQVVWLMPGALPALFRHVTHSEKMGMGAAMFGGLKPTNGALILGRDSLAYRSRKKNLEIPLSKITSVDTWQSRHQPDPWVVVHYATESGPRIVGFLAGGYGGISRTTSQILSTFAYLRSATASGSPEAAAHYVKPREMLRPVFDDRTWSLGYKASNGLMAIHEYVLPGQNVNDWTELVTTNVYYFGAQTSMTISSLMDSTRKSLVADCPQVQFAVLQDTPEDAVYEWRYHGCGEQPPQHEISRLHLGSIGIHRIAYVAKVSQLSPEQRQRWLALMKSSTLEAQTLE